MWLLLFLVVLRSATAQCMGQGDSPCVSDADCCDAPSLWCNPSVFVCEQCPSVNASCNQAGLSGDCCQPGAQCVQHRCAVPTFAPTSDPTSGPTASPSRAPTLAPSTGVPTLMPTQAPTDEDIAAEACVPVGSGCSSEPSNCCQTPEAAWCCPLLICRVGGESATCETCAGLGSACGDSGPHGNCCQPPGTCVANVCQAPTVAPTVSPTATPTTAQPTTLAPTGTPTVAPTLGPTKSPTLAPTGTPSVAPTPGPTKSPTLAPTGTPSAQPTTGAPTSEPVPTTLAPTTEPTAAPPPAPTAYWGLIGAIAALAFVLMLSNICICLCGDDARRRKRALKGK